MPPKADRKSDRNYTQLAWWCDRYDAKPFTVNEGRFADLSTDERLIVEAITEGQVHLDLVRPSEDDFLPSDKMTDAEIRAAVRLVRRGVFVATFHVSPSIGEALFRREGKK